MFYISWCSRFFIVYTLMYIYSDILWWCLSYYLHRLWYWHHDVSFYAWFTCTFIMIFRDVHKFWYFTSGLTNPKTLMISCVLFQVFVKKKNRDYFQERLLFQIAAYYPAKSYERIITAYFQNSKLLSIDCEMFVCS